LVFCRWVGSGGRRHSSMGSYEIVVISAFVY
jgi:hypothetical protein